PVRVHRGRGGRPAALGQAAFARLRTAPLALSPLRRVPPRPRRGRPGRQVRQRLPDQGPGTARFVTRYLRPPPGPNGSGRLLVSRVSGQCARPPGLPPSSPTATAAPATSVPFRVVGKGSYRSRAGKGEEPDDIDMAGGELHQRKRFGRGPHRAGRGGGARRRGIRISAAQGAITPGQGRTSPVRPVGLADVSPLVPVR